MIWKIVIILSVAIGLKYLIFWLIRNKSPSLASWAIFWVALLLVGVFALYAKIQRDEAIKQTEIALIAQEQAMQNAEEAVKQALATEIAIKEAKAETVACLELAEQANARANLLAKELDAFLNK